MKVPSQSLTIRVTSGFLLVLGLLASGRAIMSESVGVSATPMVTPTTVPRSMTWVHPGAIDSKEELDFVKVQIQAGAQPWKGECDRARSSRYANQTPHALTHINSSTGDASISRDDAIGAYTEALLWYNSDDEAYAQRAIAFLNAWSNLQGYTAGSQQDRLQAGWIGAVFASAAEIMRGYSGWTPADSANLQAMFKRAFYPLLGTARSW